MQKNTAKAGLQMPLSGLNYKLLLISLCIIGIGFALMAGGGNPSPEVFNYDKFGFQRITLAPAVLLMGYLSAGAAILIPPRKR